MARPLIRQPVPSGGDAEQIGATTLPVWTPKFGRYRIDLEFLANVEKGREIVLCLQQWQAGKRGAYSVASSVRRFLVFTVERQQALDTGALMAYRQSLEGDRGLQGRTRQYSYSNAKAFFSELQRIGVAADGDLPPGFANVEAKPKATFAESVIEWDQVKELDVYKDWLADAVGAGPLDHDSRHVLAACRGWMGTLEKLASESVELQLADWALADSVIERVQIFV